jgi:hypothetical protein
MNNDIKNSFKENFLHEPSGEFTNIVEQKPLNYKLYPSQKNPTIGCSLLCCFS